MAKINMKIKNTPIGTLDQELVKSCMQKKGFSTLEETLIYYFRKGWDFHLIISFSIFGLV